MEADPLLLTKSDARRSIRDTLRAIPTAHLQIWSAQITQRLRDRGDLWGRPGTIALFGGLRNEPDLITDLLPWLWEAGWHTVLFSIRDVELVPYLVTSPTDMLRGSMNVWEPVPSPDREINPDTFDVILVPALAFSARDGTRLGRGKGYYDRLLDHHSPHARRIGIAFEVQVLPTVPSEPHDSRVPELVTEAQWRTFT